MNEGFFYWIEVIFYEALKFFKFFVPSKERLQITVPIFKGDEAFVMFIEAGKELLQKSIC